MNDPSPLSLPKPGREETIVAAHAGAGDGTDAEELRLTARLASLESRVAAMEAGPWRQLDHLVNAALRRPSRVPARTVAVARTAYALLRLRPDARRGRALRWEHRYEEAVVAYDAALARNPGDLRALHGRHEAFRKMGCLSGALETVRRMRCVTDSERLVTAERSIVGRLRELDPTWLPDLPAPARPIEPVRGRVLHILKQSLPYHTNGYTVRSFYTLLAQAEAGLEPAVLTPVGFPRWQGVGEFPPVELLHGIPHHRLDVGAELRTDELPRDEELKLFAWMAAGVARRARPAVVHARSGFRGYENALVGLALGRHLGVPVVYEVSSFLESTWTGDVEWSERGETYQKRVDQENRCMREAAHVVTIAQSMRADIVARGIHPDHVSVVPNAVDANAFAPREKDLALARELGLEGKVVLGYVSNLGRREGIDVLIEATALLARRGLEVACLVVGDGPQRSRLEELVRSLGIGERVRLVGAVPHDRVKDHYALLDVFVVPRRDDRAARLVTPLKPYEAMAMEKPLLVSSLPALLEIVGDGERGLVFEQGSAESAAAAAEPLVRDAGLRRRLGAHARAWVIRERTWQANGERYREIYAKAAEAVRASTTSGVARSALEVRSPET
ncbi:MAG: glycosyltransferase, partial [Candidatus Binatia bacterium]